MTQAESTIAPRREEVGGEAEAPIRVLCVDYSIGFGGATKSMALLLRYTDGIEPVVITSQKADVRALWYGDWPTYLFRRLVNYRTVGLVSERLQQWKAPALVRRAAAKAMAAFDAVVGAVNTLRIALLIKRLRIDVLHLSNGFMPAEALRAAKLAGIPSIAHLRGFYSRSSDPSPPGTPSLVIGDSEAVTQSYLEGAASTTSTLTMHEVVDTPRFDALEDLRSVTREAWQLREEHVAVGLFGRVIPWKGQREFVLAMLDAMQKDPKLVAFIVGDSSDGSEQYFTEVKRLVQEAGRSDRFRFTGYVERVEPLYGAMDIVVHASIEPEPCGMVVQEGMAARRPVIAADAGGPRELIRDGVDGRLVEPGHIASLSAAIAELAADPRMRHRMGESGYRRARALYDVPVAAARLGSVYRQLSGRD
ncbi:MAG TPA: glycosyltransferase family 4 protein [Longimicrobiales bacterium]|nr:glycosyltransferase family 4 protein [Longimicrobiales bacterium]